MADKNPYIRGFERGPQKGDLCVRPHHSGGLRKGWKVVRQGRQRALARTSVRDAAIDIAKRMLPEGRLLWIFGMMGKVKRVLIRERLVSRPHVTRCSTVARRAAVAGKKRKRAA